MTKPAPMCINVEPLRYSEELWLQEALKRAGDPPNPRDYFNHWTISKEDLVTDPTKLPYLFYFDAKYHWIVKHPNGQDQVVDPELWAKFFNVEKMADYGHYLDTEVVDPFYGSMRLTVEVIWHDGMPREVNLVAPDGDKIKEDLKQFHITRDELI